MTTPRTSTPGIYDSEVYNVLEKNLQTLLSPTQSEIAFELKKHNVDEGQYQHLYTGSLTPKERIQFEPQKGTTGSGKLIKRRWGVPLARQSDSSFTRSKESFLVGGTSQVDVEFVLPDEDHNAWDISDDKKSFEKETILSDLEDTKSTSVISSEEDEKTSQVSVAEDGAEEMERPSDFTRDNFDDTADLMLDDVSDEVFYENIKRCIEKERASTPSQISDISLDLSDGISHATSIALIQKSESQASLPSIASTGIDKSVQTDETNVSGESDARSRSRRRKKNLQSSTRGEEKEFLVGERRDDVSESSDGTKQSEHREHGEPKLSMVHSVDSVARQSDGHQEQDDQDELRQLQPKEHDLQKHDKRHTEPDPQKHSIGLSEHKETKLSKRHSKEYERKYSKVYDEDEEPKFSKRHSKQDERKRSKMYSEHEKPRLSKRHSGQDERTLPTRHSGQDERTLKVYNELEEPTLSKRHSKQDERKYSKVHSEDEKRKLFKRRSRQDERKYSEVYSEDKEPTLSQRHDRQDERKYSEVYSEQEELKYGSKLSEEQIEDDELKYSEDSSESLGKMETEKHHQQKQSHSRTTISPESPTTPEELVKHTKSSDYSIVDDGKEDQQTEFRRKKSKKPSDQTPKKEPVLKPLKQKKLYSRRASGQGTLAAPGEAVELTKSRDRDIIDDGKEDQLTRIRVKKSKKPKIRTSIEHPVLKKDVKKDELSDQSLSERPSSLKSRIKPSIALKSGTKSSTTSSSSFKSGAEKSSESSTGSSSVTEESLQESRRASEEFDTDLTNLYRNDDVVITATIAFLALHTNENKDTLLEIAEIASNKGLFNSAAVELINDTLVETSESHPNVLKVLSDYLLNTKEPCFESETLSDQSEALSLGSPGEKEKHLKQSSSLVLKPDYFSTSTQTIESASISTKSIKEGGWFPENRSAFSSDESEDEENEVYRAASGFKIPLKTLRLVFATVTSFFIEPIPIQQLTKIVEKLNASLELLKSEELEPLKPKKKVLQIKVSDAKQTKPSMRKSSTIAHSILLSRKKMTVGAKKPIVASKLKLPKIQKGKFEGWDMGLKLAAHDMDHIPTEKDLILPVLKSIENKGGDYVDPSAPEIDLRNFALMKGQAEAARDYVTQRGIHELFHYMISNLVVDMPNKPLDYLINMARAINKTVTIKDSVEDCIPVPATVSFDNVGDDGDGLESSSVYQDIVEAESDGGQTIQRDKSNESVETVSNCTDDKP